MMTVMSRFDVLMICIACGNCSGIASERLLALGIR